MNSWIEEVNINQNCVFCEDGNFYLYKRLIVDTTIEELSILSTENFMVLPDIAPLMEGHVLIIPRQHYLSTASLQRKYSEELTMVKKEIARRVAEKYSGPIFFEHGSLEPKCAGSCIDHAHLHCMPGPIDFLPHLAQHFFPIRLSSYMELSRVIGGSVSYLYIEQAENDAYVIKLETKACSILPSQYLRQVVAAASNIEVWDWRRMITDALLKETTLIKIRNSVDKLRNDSWTGHLKKANREPLNF